TEQKLIMTSTILHGFMPERTQAVPLDHDHCAGYDNYACINYHRAANKWEMRQH
ncbi:hypothetical protein AAVH_23713, partial [Aphelenchoides avenae]